MSSRIRIAQESDAPAITAIYAPYVNETPISFEVVPPDTGEMRRRIAQIGQTYPWLVCEFDGAIAGYAYATRHHERAAYSWSVEVSVYVDRSQQRKGIGRALYERLLKLLERLGYCNALAAITLPNAASIGLHEAMGFKPAGVNRHVGFKHGRWWDVAYYERALQDSYPDLPTPPTTIADLGPQEVALLLRGESLL